MRTKNGFWLRTLSFLFLIFCSVGTIPQASAHAILIKSEPVAGSTIKALPEMVTLTFDTPLLNAPGTKVNSIVVTDPMRMKASTANSVVSGASISNVLNPPMLMDGIYHVSFRIVSNDGHPVTGDFIFHVDHNLNEASTGPTTTAAPHSGSMILSSDLTGEGITDEIGSDSGYAIGKFLAKFDTSEFCAKIRTRNLNNVLAIHIHPKNTKTLTVEDEILLPVDLDAINSSDYVCKKVDGKSLDFVAQQPGNYVVMLHTEDFPKGAVGGVLVFEQKQDDGHSGTPLATLLRLWPLAPLVALGLLVALLRSKRIPCRRA